MIDEKYVQVGVGVLVCRGHSVLLGLRRGSHGSGEWGPPGGHLEYGEDVVSCAIREVEEETGLRLLSVESGPYTNDVLSDIDRHYVTLFLVSRHFEGEVTLMERDKCFEWRWFSWNDLPEPLFTPFRSFVLGGFRP